jgi:hypothetical protein
MKDDSHLPVATSHNPLPAIIVGTRTGAITSCNQDAVTLFKTDLIGIEVGRFLTSPSGAMAVFLEAVMHFGRYISFVAQIAICKDSLFESSMIANCHEQLDPDDVQDPKLGGV